MNTFFYNYILKGLMRQYICCTNTFLIPTCIDAILISVPYSFPLTVFQRPDSQFLISFTVLQKWFEKVKSQTDENLLLENLILDAAKYIDYVPFL